MNKTVTIELAGEELKVRFRYDAKLITDLKEEVSSYLRRWDRDGLVWYLHPSCGRRLMRILKRNQYTINCSLEATKALESYVVLASNESTGYIAPVRARATPVKYTRKIELETE